MKRALIAYKSIYGNTERLASAVAEGTTESGDVECVIKKPGEMHTDELALFDTILFSAPNHNQEPARNIMKFMGRATILELDQTIGAVFDTYTGGNKGSCGEQARGDGQRGDSLYQDSCAELIGESGGQKRATLGGRD